MVVADVTALKAHNASRINDNQQKYENRSQQLEGENPMISLDRPQSFDLASFNED